MATSRTLSRWCSILSDSSLFCCVMVWFAILYHEFISCALLVWSLIFIGSTISFVKIWWVWFIMWITLSFILFIYSPRVLLSGCLTLSVLCLIYVLLLVILVFCSCLDFMVMPAVHGQERSVVCFGFHNCPNNHTWV